MNDSNTILLVAAAYLVLNLVVGIIPGRKSSPSTTGYVAGDRSLGLIVMFFITGATIFSAFAFLGAPGWAYSRGGAAFYILAYGTLGFIPFYFLGPRASRLGRHFGFVTQAEMVSRRFNRPSLSGVMALISVAAFIPYLALQMKGAGYVLSALTHDAVSEELGAAIVYGVVLIYVLNSGVLGVGWTNTFQGIFMMVLAWGMGLYLPHLLHGGISEMFHNIEQARPGFLLSPGLTSGGAEWTWAGYSSALLVSAIGFSFWPHLFMKAFTAKNEKTLRRTVVLYPTFQIFILPILIIGFAGVLFLPAPDKPDEILPHILMNLDLPAVVVGLFCAGALAASMSSGDAMAHAAASIAVRDGAVTALGMRPTEQKERQLIRVSLLVVMVASYVLAVVYQGNLVQLLLYAYGPVVQFAPAVVATLYWKRATGTAVLSGLLLGMAVTGALVVWPEARPWGIHEGAFGLTANLACVIILSLVFPGTRSDDEEFMKVAATENGPVEP